MISRALIDPEWKLRYRDKLISRDSALAKIPRGARIFIGSACAEPQHLVEGLATRRANMIDTEVLHILTLGIAPFADEKLSRRFRHNAFFIADNTRLAVAEGRADYTPVLLSELPGLFTRDKIRLDAALVQVSPPDRHGFVSLGVSVDVTLAALRSARYVVAEVNENVPRTLGYSFVHVDEIDVLVPHNGRLIEYESPVPDDIALKLAAIIARLVDDGSTIQIGIGATPNAVAPALMDKNDLGVHTEMFSNWLMELVEAGIVTNRKKTLLKGKCIASFYMGNRELYEWVDNNPMVSFHPSERTNDPFVIAQNNKMTAINTALELDLTGQVCSDSIGHRFYSGIGGQVDFMRGASNSPGGKAIIALASTAKNGTISTIVPHLSEGAGVVTTRGAVRYVVTEWGYADLRGKSIRERSMALISIAHPDYREWLLDEAKRLKYVYQDQILPRHGALYPTQLESVINVGGEDVLLRPVKTTDESLMKDFFYSMSNESVYMRYFHLRTMHHEQLQLETNLDFQLRMGLVAIPEGQDADEIVGIGQYDMNPATNVAECAFMVRDSWQGKGMGRMLLRRVIEVARQKRVIALTATVARGNRKMLNLFLEEGFTANYAMEEDVYSARLELDTPKGAAEPNVKQPAALT